MNIPPNLKGVFAKDAGVVRVKEALECTKELSL